MQPSLRTAAAKYASLGYGVIPLHWIKDDSKCSCGRVDCESEGKHPLGEHGASNPMLDAELVAAQWEDTPEANIGLVAGASRRVIVDLDSLAAKDHLKDICDLDTHTAMMTAPIAKTGNGWHVHFDDPSGSYAPSVGTGEDSGIDIRGGVSYIVAPPSRHKNGTTYKWIQGTDATSAPPVTAWLHDYLTGRRKAPAPILEDDHVETRGGRNNLLASLAGSMRRRGMSVTAIEAALLAENALKNKPPLPVAEVTAIARSIGKLQPTDVPEYMPSVYLGDLITERAETTERRYTFLNETQIENLPPVAYLVDKVLPLGGYGLIYGRRGSGKTFDALDLALSITTGRHYHGLATHAAGSTVAYIMSEGAAGLKKRINAWKQARLVTTIPGFHALPSSVPLNDPIALAELCLAIDQLPSAPSLLVIDTLARSASGLDENSSQDMTKYIGIVDSLRERYGCAVIPIHHAGWNAGHERGSTVIGDAADWIMKVSRDDQDVVHCATEKVKDDEQPDVWKAVFVGQDGTGSGTLEPDTTPVPIDPDVELVILEWERLSPTDQGQTSWNQICKMVGFGSDKAGRLRRSRAHDIESIGWRFAYIGNTGTTGAGYTLERIETAPQMVVE
jgi:hypothetical protein